MGLLFYELSSTLPLKLMWEDTKHQFASKIIMPWFGKSFCEYFCQQMMGRNMRQSDLFSNNMPTNEITINLNVLCPLMKNRIVCYSGGIGIVPIQRCRSSNKDTQFTKKMS
eukprot:TRINITY_DN8523_c0_g1_i1.p1 TRINITY_DN8523_c0_g1~~TRINITY_DN8523_c0_g1_i1.p1  ORF type:complete len:120 (+),score=9.11 TRINITY_DN8523_c0_g1_i1:28-360(+)